MKLEDYYSVQAAAKKAGIPRMALYQRIHRGTVPVTRISDRIILIYKDDVEKLSERPARKRSSLPWNHDDPTRDRSNPLYSCYHNMIRRCYLPRVREYAYYGARGISVCDRWLNSFQAFVDDMGPRPSKKHSIDRRDNDGNYEPGNCRWGTPKQQANNQRRGQRR